MSFRDEIREYDRLWGRGEPRVAGTGDRRFGNPLTRFRDWWHRPVLDRLDAIEARLHRPQIAVKGVRPEDVEELPIDGFRRYRCRGCRAGFGPDVETLKPQYPSVVAADLARGSWQPYPPARSEP